MQVQRLFMRETANVACIMQQRHKVAVDLRGCCVCASGQVYLVRPASSRGHLSSQCLQYAGPVIDHQGDVALTRNEIPFAPQDTVHKVFPHGRSDIDISKALPDKGLGADGLHIEVPWPAGQQHVMQQTLGPLHHALGHAVQHLHAQIWMCPHGLSVCLGKPNGAHQGQPIGCERQVPDPRSGQHERPAKLETPASKRGTVGNDVVANAIENIHACIHTLRHHATTCCSSAMNTPVVRGFSLEMPHAQHW